MPHLNAAFLFYIINLYTCNMNTNELEKISRKLSKILRHDPTPLTMDKEGWINVSDLCNHFKITLDELTWIVDNNDKKRFSFNFIDVNMFNISNLALRANQGHSKGVAEDKEFAQLKALQEEKLLYHGTDDVIAALIYKDKIIPGKRQHVHWSANIETAKKRAKQRAYYNRTEPVIIILKACSYIHSGGKIFISENEVYLTPAIDGKILKYQYVLS